MRTSLTIPVLALLSFACSGDDGADSGTDSGTNDEITIDCATDAWDKTAELEWKQAWMRTCMLPDMKELFQGHDAVRFADFDCTFCHGDDLNGGTFGMPNSFELSWAEAGTWDAGFCKPSEGSGFMPTVVVPTVAGKLGYEPFDPGTGEGFGCNGCHKGL